MLAMVQGSGLGFCHLGPGIRTYSHIQCSLKTMGTYSMLQILTPPPPWPRPCQWAKPNNGDKQLKSVRFVLGHRIHAWQPFCPLKRFVLASRGCPCPRTPWKAPPAAQWPAVRQFAGEIEICTDFN